MLTPYAGEIFEVQQCGFRSNRPTTDYILYFRKNGNTMKQNIDIY
jgi:hypothetical protein